MGVSRPSPGHLIFLPDPGEGQHTLLPLPAGSAGRFGVTVVTTEPFSPPPNTQAQSRLGGASLGFPGCVPGFGGDPASGLFRSTFPGPGPPWAPCWKAKDSGGHHPSLCTFGKKVASFGGHSAPGPCGPAKGGNLAIHLAGRPCRAGGQCEPPEPAPIASCRTSRLFRGRIRPSVSFQSVIVRLSRLRRPGAVARSTNRAFLSGGV